MICANCQNKIVRKFKSGSGDTEELSCRLDSFKIPMFNRVLVECSEFVERKKETSKKG